MYRTVQSLVIGLVLLLSVTSAVAVHPIRVVGSGDDIHLDPRSIPSEIQSGYQVYTRSCLGCHGEERIITTLKSGKSPITGQQYGEREFREKIIRILRGSKTDLDRDDARELLFFFSYLITRARIV